MKCIILDSKMVDNFGKVDPT